VLQDKTAREEHFRLALEQASRRGAQEVREGLQLGAARWALQDHDTQGALQWLDDLPQGAARRTLALRMRLKAARMARQTRSALETARLLAKHRAFSEVAAQGILRGLARELILTAHDLDQLQAVWNQLDGVERVMPEVAVEAAQRWLSLGGDANVARTWLLPVWERMVAQPGALTDTQRIGLVRVLEGGFKLASGAPEAVWLTRIEQAQMASPGDAALQYLAGIACMQLQLWGKAQQVVDAFTAAAAGCRPGAQCLAGVGRTGRAAERRCRRSAGLAKRGKGGRRVTGLKFRAIMSGI